MNIAIVDDEKKDRDTLSDCLKSVLSEQLPPTPVNIFTFESGKALLLNYEPKYDVIFLDIELVDENGIEIAKEIRKLDKMVIIIFVTNVASYAPAGYEVDALDFIVKPVTVSSLQLKMSRVFSRLKKNQGASIVIKSIDDEVLKLAVDRIKYLEVDDHYIIYHTTDGNYKEYQTLKQAEAKINNSAFVRCNRSMLVNLSFVTSIKKDSCYVLDEVLPISRPQKASFLKAYVDFLGGS